MGNNPFNSDRPVRLFNEFFESTYGWDVEDYFDQSFVSDLWEAWCEAYAAGKEDAE